MEQEFNQLVYHFYKLKAVPRIVASSPASGGSPASTAAAGSRRRIEALSIDVGTQPKPATRQRPWTRQRMEVWLRSTRCNAIFDAFVVLNSALICLYVRSAAVRGTMFPVCARSHRVFVPVFVCGPAWP